MHELWEHCTVVEIFTFFIAKYIRYSYYLDYGMQSAFRKFFELLR